MSLSMKLLLVLLVVMCSASGYRVACRSSMQMNLVADKKLPVTVLSGFLGAGKTTMLRHILQSEHLGKRYAVIVNDMSELNVDGSLVKAHVQQSDEKLVEMSNGCICCTLREDLLKEVASLARQGKFDHLIIESTGVSEPLPVAETFLFELDQAEGELVKKQGGEGGVVESLMDLAEIDSMVTVVDAVNFMRDLLTAEDLASRGHAVDDGDTRTLTDLLVSQVEFASVVVINKCDLVTPQQLLAVRQAVRALNAEARVYEAVRSKIDISTIVGSNSYDFDKVSQSAAWIKAMNEDPADKVPETEEYGISSFVYRARRPFHPTRLMSFINSKLSTTSSDDDDDEEEDEAEELPPVEGVAPDQQQRVLRSKGFFWLATRPSDMLVWSQAGGLFQITPGGPWWADTPKEMWPEDEEEKESIMADWQGDDGDRRQELVFIGTCMNKASTVSALDECLLSDVEMKQGKKSWEKFEDPFPEMPIETEEDDEEGAITLLTKTGKQAHSH